MPNASAGSRISNTTQLGADVVTSTAIAPDTIVAEDIGSGEVGTAEILDGAIVNADISASAGIVDTKLAQIVTPAKVSGAAVTLLTAIPAAAGILPTANLPPVSGMWSFLDKVTWASETGATKSFTGLTARTEFKLIFDLRNDVANSLETSFTINNITAASTYRQWTISNTTINQPTPGTFIRISADGAELARLIGEIIISGKHNGGVKQFIFNIMFGDTITDTNGFLGGNMIGNSADVSSLQIRSTNLTSGTVELWFRDAK